MRITNGEARQLFTMEYPVGMIAELDKIRFALTVNGGGPVSRRDIITRLLAYAIDLREIEIGLNNPDPVATKLGYQK